MKLHTISTILINLDMTPDVIVNVITLVFVFTFSTIITNAFLIFIIASINTIIPSTIMKLPLMPSNISIAAGIRAREHRLSSVLWMSPDIGSQLKLFGKQRGIAFSGDNSGTFYRDKDAKRKAKLIKVDVSHSTQKMSYERVLRCTTKMSSFESIGHCPQSGNYFPFIFPLHFTSGWYELCWKNLTRRDRNHHGIIRVFTFNTRIFHLKS